MALSGLASSHSKNFLDVSGIQTKFFVCVETGKIMVLQINVQKHEVVLLLLDFLQGNGLLETQRCLEKEAAMSLCDYQPEIQYLRAAVLDGRFEDAEAFLSPVISSEAVDLSEALFKLRRQNLFEMMIAPVSLKLFYPTPFVYASCKIFPCFHEAPTLSVAGRARRGARQSTRKDSAAQNDQRDVFARRLQQFVLLSYSY